VFVAYAGIVLDMWRTSLYEENAIYNEQMDFVGVEHVLAGSAYLNPETLLSFQEQKWAVQGPGIQKVGHFAPETLRTIEQELLTPRKRLVVFSDDRDPNSRVLVSPINIDNGEDKLGFNDLATLPTYNTDITGGPLPLYARIREVGGMAKTLRVEFAIKTRTMEQWQETYDRQPVLLSNRFSQTVTYDRQFAATLITTGTAVFNLTRLQTSSTSPDDYRGILSPAVPIGFRRMNVDFSIRKDGLTVDYRVVDTQLPFVIINPNIAWIECHHTKRKSTPATSASTIASIQDMWHSLKTANWSTPLDFLNSVTDAQHTGFGNLLGNVWHSIASIGGAVLGGKMSNMGGIANAGLGGVALLTSSQLPLYLESIHIEVYGTPSAKRSDLRTIALTIINDQIMTVVQGGMFGHEYSVSEDSMRRIVVVDASFISGTAANLEDALFGNNGIPGGWPANENIPGTMDNFNGQANTPSVSMSQESGTRDRSYLSILAASALNSDGVAISAPDSPRDVNPQLTGSPELP
jgi:hypothetical protein